MIIYCEISYVQLQKAYPSTYFWHKCKKIGCESESVSLDMSVFCSSASMKLENNWKDFHEI
jgi:hypothetical protein